MNSAGSSIQTDQQAIFIKMAMQAWELNIQRAERVFESLSEEDLMKEVSPGKNRGIYLLGHLIAINDTMISIFGLGERRFKILDEVFVSHPDKSGLPMPTIAELRQNWKDLHDLLKNYFGQMEPAIWFQKHTLMTDEDLIKEPQRNKLSVLINRTNHVAYHYAQVALLKK
ncbi:MAG: DinB family protein [Chitinophagales bacterium]